MTTTSPHDPIAEMALRVQIERLLDCTPAAVYRPGLEPFSAPHSHEREVAAVTLLGNARKAPESVLARLMPEGLR